MASLLNLRIAALGDQRGTEVEVKLGMTLKEFLEPQSEMSIPDAGQSILAHLPADKAYSDEGFVFATLVVEVAAQIPYQHPSHGRLVRLLKYLSRSPKLVSRSTVEGEEGLCVRFQALGDQLRDNLQGPEARDRPVEWVNYHAFLAQLEATGVWTGGMPTFAVWEMRDAFETGRAEDWQGRGEVQQAHVMAAAQWILWDGQEMFKYMANPDATSRVEERAWRLGDGCSLASAGVVSLARWQLWREGFKAAGATGSGGSHECKDLARRAAGLMDAMERAMSF